MSKRWTKKEAATLLEKSKTMSRNELAEEFGVSVKSISDKLRRICKKAEKQDKSKSVEEKVNPLDVYGVVSKKFIFDFIRTVDYTDIAKIVGINADELKETVEKTGIKLPFERARKWKEINVGKFRDLSACARCQVQMNHDSFIVGYDNCRKCIKENIKHWIEKGYEINLKFRGTD